MKKNVVYSLVALTAMPMAANAATVTDKDAEKNPLLSVDAVKDKVTVDATGVSVVAGAEVNQTLHFVPGKYTLTLKVTSGESKVRVTFGTKSKEIDKDKVAEEVTLEETLTAEGDVVFKVESVDKKAFSFTDAGVVLDYDSDPVDALVEAMQDKLNQVINKIKSYGYEGTENDLLATASIAQQLDEIKNSNTYETYVKYKLYEADLATLKAELGGIETKINEKDVETANHQEFFLATGGITLAKTALETAKGNVETYTVQLVAEEGNDAEKAAFEADAKKLTDAYDAIKANLDQYEKDAEAAYKAGKMDEFDADGAKLKAINDAITDLETAVTAAQANLDKYNSIKAAAETQKTSYAAQVAQLQEIFKDAEGNAIYPELKDAASTALAQKAKAINEAVAEALTNFTNSKPKDITVPDLGTVVSDYKTKVATLTAAKSTADGKVAAQKAELEPITTALEPYAELVAKYKDQIDAINGKITALQEKIDDANKDYKAEDETYAIETLDITADVTEIEGLISTLKADSAEDVKQAKANTDMLAVITNLKKLQRSAGAAITKALNDSYKKDYPSLTNPYAAVTSQMTKDINALQKKVNEASVKTDFMASTEWTDEVARIEAILGTFDTDGDFVGGDVVEHAQDAADNYNAVAGKMKAYQEALTDLKSKVEGLDIYTAAGYDYKGKIDALQAKIDAVQEAIDAALKLTDGIDDAGALTTEHSDAMKALAIDDLTVSTSEYTGIEDLKASYEADQAKFKADEAKAARDNVANEITTRNSVLGDKLDAFNTDYLGGTPDLGKAASDIKDEYDEIKAAYDAIQADIAKFKDDTQTPDDTEAISELTKLVNTVNDLTKKIDALTDKAKETAKNVANNKAAKDTADAAITDAASWVETVRAAIDAADPDVKAQNLYDYDKALDDIKAKLTEIQTKVDAAYGNETLAADWEKTYDAEVKAQKAAADKVKEVADAKQANYTKYVDLKKDYQEVQDKLDGITIGDTDDAKAYYDGLVTEYNKTLAGILADIEKAFTDENCVEKETEIEKALEDVEAKIEDLATDPADNHANYEALNKKIADLNTLWNKAYFEISANDESSKLTEWLNKLNDIKAKIDALDTKTPHDNGKLADDGGEDYKAINDAITDYTQKINDLLAQQKAGYDKQIAEDNAATFNYFKLALQNAQDTYNDAIATQEACQNVENEDLAKAIAEATKDLNADIYPFAQQIKDLYDTASEAYAAPENQSPNVFDAKQDFAKAAVKLAVDIQTVQDAFETAVATAVKNFWAVQRPSIVGKISTAESFIAAYSAEAQEGAYDDVKALVAAADAACAAVVDADGNVVVLNAENINALDAAVNALADINNMLRADWNEAAYKDLDATIKTYEQRANEARTYLASLPFDETTMEQKQQELETLIYNSVRTARNQTDKFHEYVQLPEQRDYILALLKDFDDSNLIFGLETNEALYEGLADDLADVSDLYDEVAEQIEQLTVKVNDATPSDDTDNDTFLEKLASYKALIEQLQNILEQAHQSAQVSLVNAAVGSKLDDLDANLTLLLLDAIQAERDYLTDYIENTLKPEYNIYATDVYDENGDFDTKKMEEVEAVKKEIEDLKTKVAVAGTVDELVELEAQIAELRTKIANHNNESAAGAALAALNEKIDAIIAEATLEGYNQNVIDMYQAEVDAIKAELEALKEEANAKDNILFYADQFNTQADQLNAKLDAVKAEATAKQEVYDVNDKVYAKFNGIIDDYKAQIAAAKETIDGYENVKAANYEGYGDDPYYWSYYEFKSIEAELSSIATSVEAAHDAIGLTNSTSYDAQFASIDSNLDVVKRMAAYQDLNAYYTALNSYRNSLMSQLAGTAMHPTLKSQIQNDLNMMYSMVYNYRTAINDANYHYDSTTGTWVTTIVEDHDNLAARYPVMNDMLDAIAVRINASQEGDVNGDGKVTVRDYNQVISFVLNDNAPTEGDAYFRADLNQDGKINIADATQVRNLVLYGDKNGAVTSRFAGNGEEAVNAQMNGNRIALSLTNVKAYVGLQFDVVLPEGMTLVGESLSSRAADHSLMSNTLANGAHRVVVLSDNISALTGNNGAVVYLDVETDGTYNGAEVTFDNVLFVEADSQTTEFAVAVNGATGINSVENNGVMGKIYNVGGKMVNALKKGINIIRNEDGSARKVVK